MSRLFVAASNVIVLMTVYSRSDNFSRHLCPFVLVYDRKKRNRSFQSASLSHFLMILELTCPGVACDIWLHR